MRLIPLLLLCSLCACQATPEKPNRAIDRETRPLTDPVARPRPPARRRAAPFTMLVYIQRDGWVMLAGKRSTLDELRLHCLALREREGRTARSSIRITLRAHPAVTTDRLQAVIRTLTKLGITDIRAR